MPRVVGFIAVFVLFTALVAASPEDVLTFTTRQPQATLSFTAADGAYSALVKLEGAPETCFSFGNRQLSAVNSIAVKNNQITQRLNYELTCGFCGKAKLTVGLTSLQNQRQYLLDIPCGADVLLFTSSNLGSRVEPDQRERFRTGYQSALSAYIQTLARRGLTARYVIIDSPIARRVFGVRNVLIFSTYELRKHDVPIGSATPVFRARTFFKPIRRLCAVQKSDEKPEEVDCNGAQPNAIEYEMLADLRRPERVLEKRILTKRAPRSYSYGYLYLVDVGAGRGRIKVNTETYLAHARAQQASWRSIKDGLDLVLSKVGAHTIIILGGDDVIPVPQYSASNYVQFFSHGDKRLETSLKTRFFYVDVASDDYYGITSPRASPTEVPNRVVSRFPDVRGGSGYLVVDQLHSVSKNMQKTGGQLIISDAAGTSDFLLKRRADRLSRALSGRQCTEPICLLAPPYCQKTEHHGLSDLFQSRNPAASREECSKKTQLLARFSQSSLIFTFLHGGVSALPASASEALGGEEYIVFTNRDFSGPANIVAKGPIIFSYGCSTASIDLSCSCPSSCTESEEVGVGVGMMSGAVAVLGFSRNAQAGLDNTLDIDFYLALKAKKTVGQAFLAAKQAAFAKGKTLEGRASLTTADGRNALVALFNIYYNARILQLFGDPTVKVFS